MILHWNQKKGAKTWGETRGGRAPRVVLKKSIIDNCNIIGSDCSRAGVDEETALVCLQRQRTDGATAVRRLDDDGRGG